MVAWIKSEHEWKERVLRSEACTKTNTKDILLPWCLGMMETKMMCEKYKGQITVITNAELQSELFSALEEYNDTEACFSRNRVWTGFSDAIREGSFIDVNEGAYTEDNFDPFPMPHSRRNGGRAQNCAGASREYPFESSWYDTLCTRKDIASFCRIDKNQRLQIRGEGLNYDEFVCFPN